MVHRRSKGKTAGLFIQDNYYYLCDIGQATVQELDDYEDEERFTPEFVTPRHTIDVNRLHDHQGRWSIVQERDSAVLERLMCDGYFD